MGHAVTAGAGRSEPDYIPPPNMNGPGILESDIGGKPPPPVAGDEIPPKATGDEVRHLNQPSKEIEPIKNLGKAMSDVLGMSEDEATAPGSESAQPFGAAAPEDLDAADATEESGIESQMKKSMDTAAEKHEHKADKAETSKADKNKN